MTSVGVSLATRRGDGGDAVAHLRACADAVGDLADFLWLNDKPPPIDLHSPTTLAWLLPQLRTPRAGVLVLAAARPLAGIIEQMRSLHCLAAHHGLGLDVVVAAGRPDASVARDDRGAAAEDVVRRLQELHEDIGIWVAAERGRALDRAGRLKRWVGNANHSEEALVEQLRHVRTAAGDGALLAAVRRDVLCADDDAAAERQAADLLASGYRSGFRLEDLIVGSPQTCATKITALGELGMTHVALRPMQTEPDAAAATLQAVLSEMATP